MMATPDHNLLTLSETVFTSGHSNTVDMHKNAQERYEDLFCLVCFVNMFCLHLHNP